MRNWIRHSFTVAALTALAAPAAAQSAFTLDTVSFLGGCWVGQMGPSELRERWTSAEPGMMLGNTRFLQNGQIVDWEFGQIVEEPGGGVTLWPYPRGNRSDGAFRLIRADGEFVFEDPENDFPVRIVYIRDSNDALRVRLEAQDGREILATLNRVGCDDDFGTSRP